MGFFSKAIPQRRWTDVGAALCINMKKYRASWFKDFVGHVFPLDIGLRSRELTPQIEEIIGILQFSVAATTVRENGYVKLRDWDHFVDLMSRLITSKKLDELDYGSFLEIAAAPDPKIAIQKWALMMLPLVSGTTRNQKLAEVLSHWAIPLVVTSKMLTCEACGDREGAEKVRDFFRS